MTAIEHLTVAKRNYGIIMVTIAIVFFKMAKGGEGERLVDWR